MPFFITLLSGLSTLLGFLFIYIDDGENKIIYRSLSFAAGVMLFISIFDLIPESLNLLLNNYFSIFGIILVLLFFIVGYIISFCVSRFTSNKNNSNLYHVGLISMIGIILHNIPEGIVTFLTANYDIKFGFTLAIAITLHNIPEGISISVPIYYSTFSKKKTFLYTFISGISEFIGGVIAFLFLRKYVNNYLMGCLYGIIAGIMVYISLSELLSESFKYKHKLDTIFYFILGMFFISISIIFLN